MDTEIKCKDCAKYKGDCGYHHVDENGHVNYEICSEAAADKFGVCQKFNDGQNKIKVLTHEDRERIFQIKRRHYFNCPRCDTFFMAEKGAFSYGTQREPECSCVCPVCGEWAYEY